MVLILKILILFAKIYLNQTPFHSTIIQHIKKEFIFYDQLLQNFQNIKIIITDPNGEILELGNEHSFTLEIYQIINVLRHSYKFKTRKYCY